MQHLPLEIIQMIVNKCDFLSKIKLSRINRYFNENTQIHDLIMKSHIYHHNFTDEILQQIKFRNLKILYACNIFTQKGISKLNLLELRVYNNKKIKDVTFMKNLKVLDVVVIVGLIKKAFMV